MKLLSQEQLFHYWAVVTSTALGNWSNPDERIAQLDNYARIDTEIVNNPLRGYDMQVQALNRLVGYRLAKNELFDSKGKIKADQIERLERVRAALMTSP